MHSSALDFESLAWLSAICIAGLALVYFGLRRMIDGAPTVPVIEDADIDDLTDPDVPAYLLEADDFVDAVPTPVPTSDVEMLRCSLCSAFLSSLTAEECWCCSQKIAKRGAA